MKTRHAYRATHGRTTVVAGRHGVEVRADQIVGDYIPSDPTGVTELPAAYAEFAAGFTEAERTRGPALATLALGRFATPPDADVCELVVTHNFTIGGFVCSVLGGPPWRWMSLNQAMWHHDHPIPHRAAAGPRGVQRHRPPDSLTDALRPRQRRQAVSS